MKYISFAIPCYNSQDYMAHAIESILPGGEDTERLSDAEGAGPSQPGRKAADDGGRVQVREPEVRRAI